MKSLNFYLLTIKIAKSFNENQQFMIVLLRYHFFQGRSVSVGVSVKKSVVDLGFGVYTRAPSATVRSPQHTVCRCGPSRRARGVRAWCILRA